MGPRSAAWARGAAVLFTAACSGEEAAEPGAAAETGATRLAEEGAATDDNRESDGSETAGTALPAGAEAEDGRFVAVAAGREHTCALRADGGAECWGDNDSGKAAPPSGH